MPRPSSCDIVTLLCQLYGRTPKPSRNAGSYRRTMTDLPNVVLVMAPHSPLAARFLRSHCGIRSLAMPPPAPLSVHVRDADAVNPACGFLALAIVVISEMAYRPTATLSAVLPLPNTSKAAPSRGSTSFQFGRLSTFSNCISGKKNDFGRVDAGAYAFSP